MRELVRGLNTFARHCIYLLTTVSKTGGQGGSRVAHPVKALARVQDALYSLDVASSSPGYSTADRGRELPGGGAQLAERRPGGGRVRSVRVFSAHRSPATPVVWPGACGLACKLPESCVVLRRCSSWVAAW